MRFRSPAVAFLATTLLAAPAATQSESESPAASDEKNSSAEDTEKKGFWSRFKDPEDGRFDVTAGGDGGTSGILPLFIPFNEPAVGVGAVLAVAYFHGDPEEEPTTDQTNEPKVPPSTTFAGAALTENGTWAAAAGHLGVWKDGRVRYLGAGILAKAYLTYYGIGQDPESRQSDFTIDALGTLQQVEFKIGESKFYWSGRYDFIVSDVDFAEEEEVQIPGAGQTQNAGLTFALSYDTRDNLFSPSSGTRGRAAFAYYSDALGGEFDYGRVDLSGFRYQRLAKKWVLGLRLEASGAGDDAPFYALPGVELRGIPALRYLGNYVLTTEIEPRYFIDDRWSVLAFVGTGRAGAELADLPDEEKAYNAGVGFRYVIARKLGLAMGIDVAVGPEDTVGYLTIGSAW